MRQIKISNCRITRVATLEDGTSELTIEIEEKAPEAKIAKEPYVLVEASKLSLNDKFMRYQPKTVAELEFKEMLTVAIKRRVKDFYRPICDPSFTEDGKSFCYVAGMEPALGKTYNWWVKTSREFDKKNRSRLGKKSEYIVFLGVLIKQLIDEGWTVEDAWNAVCNDSRELGHYLNSKNAKYDLEPTASREICSFFDLANTYKILAEDNAFGGFYLAGGFFMAESNKAPLANYFYLHDPNCDNDYKVLNSVGWVVVEANYPN